jgi:hypothetical protein
MGWKSKKLKPGVVERQTGNHTSGASAAKGSGSIFNFAAAFNFADIQFCGLDSRSDINYPILLPLVIWS